MNKLSCAISLILCFGILSPLVAQNNETLSRDVTVEKAYDVTLEKQEKLNTTPQTEEVNEEKLEVNYSLFSKTESTDYILREVKEESYNVEREEDAKKGIFKAGFGFYYKVLGDFYYPLLQGDKYLLDINLKHRSSWSHITLEDGTTPRAQNHLTNGALTFENQFKDSRLSAKAFFDYRGYDYYGMSTDLNDPMKDTIGTNVRAGVHFALYSTDTKKAFQHHSNLGYAYFGRNFDISEHKIDLNTNLSGTVGNGRLGAYIGTDIFVYDVQHTKNGLPQQAAAFIKASPYYQMSGENWHLNLGANLYSLIEENTKYPFAGSAQITGQFALVPNLFYLYAGITGDFEDNDYASIIRENKYIDPTLRVEPTYTPLITSVSTKIRIMTGLLASVGFEYQLKLNEHFYVNELASNEGSVLSDPSLYKNTFTVEYEDLTNLIDVSAGLYFDYVKGLDISLTGHYYYWGRQSGIMPWHKPAWEVSLDATYHFLEKWQVGLSYNMQLGRYALVANETVPMNDIHDLNVFISYKALDWLSVFANGKNLINIQADSYYGYRNYGINAMIGATFSF